MHEELDQIFGSDKDRDITTADLKQLKYLECCVKEALRIFPSVPFFMRRADQDIPLGPVTHSTQIFTVGVRSIFDAGW